MKTLELDFIQNELWKLCDKAAQDNEVPIAALVIEGNEILSRAHNQTEARGTFTAHAELLAIEEACRKKGSKYLTNCELYVSLEPCVMCFTAARLARISKLIYILPNEKFGFRSASSQNAYGKLEAFPMSCQAPISKSFEKQLSRFFESKR